MLSFGVMAVPGGWTRKQYDPLIIVTGASGIVGSALIPPLRESYPSHALALITRSPSGVRADICQVDLGLDRHVAATLKARTTAIIHCAAETRFNQPIEQARRVNVEGVRRMLDFAQQCPRLEQFAHVSTLYIAGRRPGCVREEPLRHNDGYFNTYEQSKHEAEDVVLAESERLPVAIYRLSSVVGSHSRRGHVHQVLRLVPYCSEFPVIPGDPDTPVDLIEAGWAGRALAFLMRQPFSTGRILHICAGEADSLGVQDLIDFTFDIFERTRSRRLDRPRLIPLAAFERSCTRALSSLMTFLPHFGVAQPFDPGQARSILASAGLNPRPVREFLARVMTDEFRPAEVLS